MKIDYDKDADVLYLTIQDEEAISTETPKGNLMRFNKEGELVGITFIDFSKQI